MTSTVRALAAIAAALLGFGLVAANPPSGDSAGQADAKREENLNVVLTADDDGDDGDDDTNDGGDDTGTNRDGTGVSRDATNSRYTGVSRDRDRSRGDLTRDWTRDGGDRTRDFSRNQTNDRSRNDTR